MLARICFLNLFRGLAAQPEWKYKPGRTNYYEVVPKNALELALWAESDRMGYLENTVTKSAMANQQNVVQNEKRQSVDNAAYGHNSALIARTMFPQGHPYSWTVIGEMEDLANASIEDVKAFHSKFYVPGNATLLYQATLKQRMLKALVEKYFGEIPASVKPEKRVPMPVTLAATTKFIMRIILPGLLCLRWYFQVQRDIQKIHTHLIFLLIFYQEARKHLFTRYL